MVLCGTPACIARARIVSPRISRKRFSRLPMLSGRIIPPFCVQGTGSVEWEWIPILKRSLIQTPVQFSRDLYVAEMPGRMGICMPYVVYPINSSRVLVRELFGFDHRVGHFWPLSIMGVVPKLPCPQ